MANFKTHLLRHHHLHKLPIIDLTITINVSFPDHLIDFLICELFTQVRHDMAQLAAVIRPLPSRSNTLKASMSSSSESVSFILRAMSDKNSGKSMVPLPSASTSLIMSCNSASVGFWPRERMTVPNSLVVMVPSPSLSKREKASLNSAICSSVS